MSPTTRTLGASSAARGEVADPFGFDEETDSEKLSRTLHENDLRLLWSLRHIRESKAITQAELAERMGIAQPTLAAFESQANDPKLSTIRRYAHALGVLIDHSINSVTEINHSDWGSSRVVHLPSVRARRTTARAGWR
ncbi:helix-turn-helix domain-containing protein [Clavibacter michiganensis]|uniref:helix-turn-helix domain-containing protein n=1 Tax=Clavibacter michiganensis TaxID=28447 RepID=UPI003EBA1A3B